MPARAFITGLNGLTITVNERAFIREAQPWGLIIFKRNVKTFQQVIEFIQSFREIVGWPAPVLVDQEGGRVQRLGPPHWPIYPAGGAYGGPAGPAPPPGGAGAPPGRARGARPPRLRHHARQGVGARHRDRRRPAGRRGSPGAEAPARTRPRQRR